MRPQAYGRRFAVPRSRLDRGQHGQILVFAALLAPVILGLAGIAIDVGFAMHERSKAANAADAAALAGADVLMNGGSISQAQSASFTYAQKNGYDSTKTSVYIPPISGPHTGQSDYVEVRIASSNPTIFMRVLHIDTTAVGTRAVAAFVTPPKNYALVVLDHTACSAYNQSSNSTLTINNGGALVNSSCNPSASQSGGSFVSATSLDYYQLGGWQLNNNATTSVPPSQVTSQLADPLASLPRPIPCNSTTAYTPTGCTVLQSPDSGGTQANPTVLHVTASAKNQTLHPGVYWGGININGTGGGGVMFLPGTYIFAGGGSSGGFNYSSTTPLSGNGVTFFNTGDPSATSPSNQPCGPFSLTGAGVLNFTAPTSGIWKNMLFWQDNSCTATFQYGGGNNTTAGVIYAPTAQLSVSGGGNLGAVQIIVDTFTYSGSAPVTINYTDYVQIVPPMVVLVE